MTTNNASLETTTADETSPDEGVEGAGVVPAWRKLPVLAELSEADAEAAAQRVAAAWMAPDADPADLDESQLSDQTLLATVHEQGGHLTFIDFLRSFDGVAGELGATLDTALLLGSGDRQLAESAKLSNKELEVIAARLSDLVLDGELDTARREARDLLVKIRSTIDRSRTSNPLAKLLRSDTSGLRAEVADLLAALSTRR